MMNDKITINIQNTKIKKSIENNLNLCYYVNVCNF